MEPRQNEKMWKLEVGVTKGKPVQGSLNYHGTNFGLLSAVELVGFQGGRSSSLTTGLTQRKCRNTILPAMISIGPLARLILDKCDGSLHLTFVMYSILGHKNCSRARSWFELTRIEWSGWLY